MGPGRRGPQRTPTAVLKLRGSSLVKDREAEHEVEPEPGVPEKPGDMVKDVSAVWDRTVPILEEMGVLTVADGGMLAAYCNAYARSERANAKERAARKLDTDVWHRAFGIADRAAITLHRLGAAFGLDPSSRSRIHAVKPKPADAKPGAEFFKKTSA